MVVVVDGGKHSVHQKEEWAKLFQLLPD